MADKEIRLVGSFKDDISPKLARLSREIDGLTKSFTKMQGKLRPITRDLGVMAMASERLGASLKSQRGGFETNIRAMQQYRSEMGKVARAQKAVKPTTLPAPRIPRVPRGGGVPAVPRARGGYISGGAGIGEIAIGSAIGGVMTSAIVAGFQQGVNLMMAPMRAFGNAFAERVGDEMEDIKSAGGMFALDKKNKTPLFSSFEDAMAMQEGLNRSLAKSAAALPGATNDYVRAARGLTDTVMGAFGKNEEAFKKFATELGAKEGATSEEAITKVLSRFTEQTVLLGQGQTGGMPLTMLMEQLVTRESVSIQSMQARYAQLRSNPLLANMLQDAEKEINASTAGTAERFKAVMKALDNALPQEVVNKMRRSVSGLQEAARSAFLDPDTGLFGLSRELDMAIPKVDQFGRAVGKLGDKEVALTNVFEKNGKKYGYALDKMGKATNQVVEVAQENTSLFKILKETLANFAVPILELLGVLPQIFDPFAQIAEQFKDLREVSNRFYVAFNTYTNGFEDQAKSFFDAAAKTTDPKIKSQLERQANMLKEQAGGRGALGAINKALVDFGAISQKEYQKNVKELTDFDPKAIEKFGDKGMAEMGKRLLVQLSQSDLVAGIAETIGAALGAAIDTLFRAIDGLFGAIEGKTGNKMIDAFTRGFTKIITPERAAEIGKIIERVLQKLFNMISDVLINRVLPMVGKSILLAITSAWNAGPLGKFLVVVGVLGTFQKAVMAAQAALQTMAAVKGGALDALGLATGGKMGPGRLRGRPQVLARQGVRGARNMLQAATAAPAGAVTGLAQRGGLLSFLGGAGGKNFMAGLKAVSPKLMIFGGVLSAIIALFEGKGIVGALAEGLGAAGGSAIGAAIGTVIFPGIGTAIGAALGGWIGTMDGVTIPLRDAFQAITDTIGPIVGSVADAFGSVFQAALSVVSMFNPFASRIGSATEGMDGLHATIIGVKIALTPIVAAFQLLEQTMNLVVVGLKGLELAILYARLGLSKLNPFGSDDARQRLVNSIRRVEGELDDANGKFKESWDRHSKWYTTEAPSAASAMRELGSSASSATANLTDYQKKTQELVKKGQVSSAAGPTAADAEWYKRTTGQALPTKTLESIDKMQESSVDVLKDVETSTQRTADATRSLSSKFSGVMPVRVVNLPTPQAFTFNPFAGAPRNPLTAPSYDPTGVGTITDGGPMPNLFQWQQKPAWPYAKGNFSTPLGKAISYEMKHKPAGSDLVVANSSETIIPAAKGLVGSYMRSAPMQTLVASASQQGGGGFDVSKVEVTVVDNTGNISAVADQVAEQFLTQMYKASLSFDGRAG